MHSANMVKEVLQRNLILSEDIVKCNQEVDNLNKEIFLLQQENQEVWDRLNIIETLTGKDSAAVCEKLKNLGTTTTGFDTESPTSKMYEIDEEQILKLLSEDETAETFQKNKDKILSTIYKLTKEKQILQRRVENLEKNKIRSNQFRMTQMNMSMTQ